MKIGADDQSTGPVLHELHNAGVDLVLLERTGPGWMLKLTAKVGPTVVENITRAGGIVMPHAQEETQ